MLFSILFPLLLWWQLPFVLPSSEPPPDLTRPNVIVIYMDDLGFGDLSCYGALGYETPAIDRLASQGMRFTQFLSAQAVCSASRAALLTGCYPNRVGVSGAYFPNATIGLHPQEITLAELLKQKDYRTAAIGKWHLGDHPLFMPLQQGFDSYFGIPYSNDMWPVGYDGTGESAGWKKSIPPLPLILNRDTFALVRNLTDQGQLTRRYTEKAVDFITANRAYPFFLYLAHTMPHVPIAVSERFAGHTGAGLFADVMAEMDWSVDTIVRTLAKYKLSENTLILFSSDNGPWLNYGHHAGSSGGLREGKGTSFEGGHRVPAIFYWPGRIPPRTCNQLASTIDVLPTLADLLNIPLPPVPIDGMSLLPLLNGRTDQPIRREFLYYYRKNALEAVRMDHWKRVFPHPGRTYTLHPPGQDGYPGTAPEDFSIAGGLYDLRRDPGECYDLSQLFPDILRQLDSLAAKARSELGDELTGFAGKGRRPVGDVTVLAPGPGNKGKSP